MNYKTIALKGQTINGVTLTDDLLLASHTVDAAFGVSSKVFEEDLKDFPDVKIYSKVKAGFALYDYELLGSRNSIMRMEKAKYFR